MKRKIVKITETQLKKVLEGLINEQRSSGVNTGNTVTQKPAPVGNKNQIYSSGPNNMGGQRPQEFDEFISKSKLSCVRGGDLEFGKDAQLGLYVKFYISSDKKQSVTIYSNGRANVVMMDESGKFVNKMVTAKCETTPPLKDLKISLYEGGKVMYILDPKNPIKKTAPEINKNIVDWQKILVNAGYDLGTNNPYGYGPGIDGLWGKKTQAAYEQYKARERRITEPASKQPSEVRVSGLEPVPSDKLKLGLDQKIGRPNINIPR